MPTLQSTNAVFQAFADPTRLRLLNLIGYAGEVCVCDLVRVLGMPQPKVSRHLALLRDADLVVGRKDGRWVYYSLARPVSPLHRRLLACVRECCVDVELLADDLARLKSCGCALDGDGPAETAGSCCGGVEA